MAVKMEQMIIRVPEGTKLLLDEYVNLKAEINPEDTRYSTFNGKAFLPSMTAFIRYLIETELEVDLNKLPTDRKSIQKMADDKANKV